MYPGRVQLNETYREDTDQGERERALDPLKSIDPPNLLALEKRLDLLDITQIGLDDF